MKKIFLLLSIIFMIQTLTTCQQPVKRTNPKKVLLRGESSLQSAKRETPDHIRATKITGLEFPKTNAGEIIITHSGYSLVYNEKYEQASWVAYELTKEETEKSFNRTNKFIIDPQVTTLTANNADYLGSGYDRGHLAPAGDMSWSSTSMAESFYNSNMSPQEPGFNRGIWKRLEELVRTWAVDNQMVYVVTGPVLTSGLSSIGNNKVSVPKFYYKVILDYTDPEIKGIGFILPNKNLKGPLQNYAVTIDSVEKFTGIDFFPLIPDEREKIIESSLILQSWSWKSSNTSTSKEKSSASVRCNGITKAGNQCKNKTLNVSGYCYLHEGQAKDGLGTSVAKPQTDQATGKTANGQTIYTGPRGGKYHYSKSGNKVYERKE